MLGGHNRTFAWQMEWKHRICHTAQPQSPTRIEGKPDATDPVTSRAAVTSGSWSFHRICMPAQVQQRRTVGADDGGGSGGGDFG